MALPKTFKASVQISGLAEGSTGSFPVDFDTLGELESAIVAKLDTFSGPAQAILDAVQAARDSLAAQP